MDRFWSKVDKSGDCWNWTAYRGDKGYGRFGLGGKSRRAHIVAYELAVGPIPAGMLVCHRCDNPPCCNPAHLFLGSNGDNVRDCWAKGRMSVPHVCGVRHGRAKLTDEKVRAIRADPRATAIVASEMGVSRGTIGRIRSGKLWASTAIPARHTVNRHQS